MFGQSFERKQITVRINGDADPTGKRMYIDEDWSWDQFLKYAGQSLQMNGVKRVFNTVGNEIDDCMMLEDQHVYFISDGAPFRAPVEALTAGDDPSGLPSSVGVFDVHEELGVGGFGRVMRGVNKMSREESVALKFLRKKDIQSLTAANMLAMEIQCLSMMKHQNILRLHERVETPVYVVLAIDLMTGGDLSADLLSRGTAAADIALPEDDARHIFRQILNGVNYMHQQRVVHRDLKLENILLCGTSARLVKISDFGMATICKSSTMLSDKNGTLLYMAPEVLELDSFAGPPLDMWALGNILFALVCGRLPFLPVASLASPVSEWPETAAIEARIRACDWVFEAHAYPGARRVVEVLLRRDPAERSLLTHAWVRGSFDVTTVEQETEHRAEPKKTAGFLDELSKSYHGSSSDKRPVPRFDEMSRSVHNAAGGGVDGQRVAFGATRRASVRNATISDVDRSLGERSRMITKQLEELDKSLSGHMDGGQVPQRKSGKAAAAPDPFAQLASTGRRGSGQLGADGIEATLSNSRHGDRRDGGSRRGSAVAPADPYAQLMSTGRRGSGQPGIGMDGIEASPTDSGHGDRRDGSSGSGIGGVAAAVRRRASASGSTSVEDAATPNSADGQITSTKRGVHTGHVVAAALGRIRSTSSCDLVDELDRSMHDMAGSSKMPPPVPRIRQTSRTTSMADELDKSMHSTATGRDSGGGSGGKATDKTNVRASRSAGSLASSADSPVTVPADRQSVLARTARNSVESHDGMSRSTSREDLTRLAGAGGSSASPAIYIDDDEEDVPVNFGFRPAANTARRASDAGRTRTGSVTSVGSGSALSSQSARVAPSKR